MNKLFKQDIAKGHKWCYTNKTSRKAKTFDNALKYGKYWCNCVDGVQWALKRSGLAESDGLAWYGSEGSGMNWIGSNSKKNAEKYLKVKKIGNKTVGQLKASGQLRPGDIVTYMTFSHTNVFLGGNKWFDSGHATCTQSTGDGVPYKKSGWICTRKLDNYRVGYILRVKETVSYRVRVGIYSVRENADAKLASLAAVGLDGFLESQKDGLHVYSGKTYSKKPNAQARMKELADKKIAAVIETVKV